MSLAFIVHGGAWDIPDSEVDAHLNACRNALTAGWTILRDGGSALDAVQAAVMILEDDPALDAGIGSLLTADGTVELDAGIMRGSDLQCGAVASVRRIQNPIVLARRVMESDYVMFTGEGAEAFGVSQGMTLIDPQQLIVARERQKYERWRRGELRVDDKGEIAHDTVGAVAMDKDDHIVVGVSTGGTPFTPAGRVGDVPQVGCGFYADDTLGGAVSTGHGEAIARVVLAKTAVDLLRDGATAHEAAQMAVTVLRQRVNGSGGVIIIDADGRIGFAHNTTRMARGYISEGMSVGVFGV